MTQPDKRILLNTQKNDLWSIVHNNGFDPADFVFGEGDDGAYLKRRSTEYSCLISIGEFRKYTKGSIPEPYTVPFRLVYSPGRHFLQEQSSFPSWEGVLTGVTNWLNCLKSELHSPDLWATVSGDTQLIRLAADQDNRPFTSDEQLQVSKALNEIKKYLAQSQRLTEEQARMLEARFEYMEDAATRLGRKDWAGIFVSTLLGIVYSLALGADSARDLFRFAGQVVKQLLGTVLYLVTPH